MSKKVIPNSTSAVTYSISLPVSVFLNALSIEFQDCLKDTLKCSDVRYCRLWCRYDDNITIEFVNEED